MGFAVVADEVRRLAQRSAEAAKETASLIEESINASQNGAVKLRDVANAYENITKSASGVTALSGDVRGGSLDQVQRLNQLAGKTSAMQKMNQDTAAGAEESAEHGNELAAQSDNLRQIVVRLVGIVGA